MFYSNMSGHFELSNNSIGPAVSKIVVNHFGPISDSLLESPFGWEMDMPLFFL